MPADFAALLHAYKLCVQFVKFQRKLFSVCLSIGLGCLVLVTLSSLHILGSESQCSSMMKVLTTLHKNGSRCDMVVCTSDCSTGWSNLAGIRLQRCVLSPLSVWEAGRSHEKNKIKCHHRYSIWLGYSSNVTAWIDFVFARILQYANIIFVTLQTRWTECIQKCKWTTTWIHRYAVQCKYCCVKKKTS